ncbi:MAG TPA: type II 3-dehydroquinate dehydratase [Segeticoccus sp.]|nr:type II 3-dehydroquinate dehydratase [Segeticoccus sp.]
MSGTIGILNGPNLNLLGTREPDLYGHETLADVEKLCRDAAAAHGLEVDFRQSNHEGELVEAVHEMREQVGGIVVNGGAYTHTSIALRDALLTFRGPIVEVHLSNVFAREPFRHHSYLSDISEAVIVGCGPLGYRYAIAQVVARFGR